ncbi:MAG: hypothetical protein WCX97_05560 [Candidatus Magasanikbacteria bacterium]|jgi:hypothetical protein
MKLFRRKFCECGCGTKISSKKRFVHNHHFVGKPKSIESNLKRKESMKGKNTMSWDDKYGIKKAKEMKEKLRLVAKSNENFVKNQFKKGHITVPPWAGKTYSDVLSKEKIKIRLIKMRKSMIGKNLGKKYGPLSEKRKIQNSIVMKKLRSDPNSSFNSKEYINNQKKKWDNIEWKNFMVKKLSENRKLSPNKPEKQILNILNKLYPNEWKFVGDWSFVLGGKNPDFVNVNGQKKIIELYGDYWHRGQNPQDRIDLFKQYGYKTLVLWEHELKNEQKVISKFERFI